MWVYMLFALYCATASATLYLFREDYYFSAFVGFIIVIAVWVELIATIVYDGKDEVK